MQADYSEIFRTHDAACGTGRAIRMLDGLVHAAHGYDTSEAMLQRARHRRVNAKLHHLDEHAMPAPARTPGQTGPAVVTMLRFLLNVTDRARDQALSFAAQVLTSSEAGLLVLENHGPRHSLRGIGRRRKVNDPWFAELSHAQVADMLERHGFHIVTRKGFAVCPSGSYRNPLTRRAARIVDTVGAQLPVSAVATNVLYLARRNSSGPRRVRLPAR